MKDSQKLTSEAIKHMIADHCSKTLQDIYDEFDRPPEGEIDEIRRAATDPACWKRAAKRKSGTHWMRIFDCEPLDDQLRAYVLTDESDVSVVSIHVAGE